jgi:hypothetical protein
MAGEHRERVGTWKCGATTERILVRRWNTVCCELGRATWRQGL